MSGWKVDGKSEPGILAVRLEGRIELAEMREFVRAHNAAIDAFGPLPYRVLCDIREMAPLSPDAAAEMERAKLYSGSRPNFQGSAVLVTSQLVAMQHRRTSTNCGVMATELISDDEAACMEHLRRVRRR